MCQYEALPQAGVELSFKPPLKDSSIQGGLPAHAVLSKQLAPIEREQEGPVELSFKETLKDSSIQSLSSRVEITPVGYLIWSGPVSVAA